jgi:endonuclease-8
LRLGHDPLREDADAEALWEKVRVSKKPIGGILMDQTMIAGVGNIYRAEILFKVGRCFHGWRPSWRRHHSLLLNGHV